ncbi:DUF1772 domain-containing protein [Pseudarthrobacter polychromogenes]|uniref:DUF1772 domain-containing protein n=1 Tax=Pseudarthrobacter polychromogenes TaxID=1676 RepID=A0ABQ1XI51_9MICC|nr:DUF1772 domain-containing protein [Pseudarthrobacter polychromogenes]GGG94140.1 hypothetical protein GCM10011577_16290 [Pseudarthrobacter polychromogenes]
MLTITLLLSAATVTLAGIGGLYYSYACSVMPGLRSTDDATFVSAMSQINSAIQTPVFALSFFGAFLSLAAASAFSWGNGLDSAAPVSVALACYTATMAITFCVNIPLNNQLAVAARLGDAAARDVLMKSGGRAGICTALGCLWLALLHLASLGPLLGSGDGNAKAVKAQSRAVAKNRHRTFHSPL